MIHGLADCEASKSQNRLIPLTLTIGKSFVHTGTTLSKLRDDMLFENPFADGEDKDLILWQVLLHVGNHGTDHRAQLLRLLNDLGVKTAPQDYIFYVYDNL
jgi:uncharacterized damage-inducible protein DinB